MRACVCVCGGGGVQSLISFIVKKQIIDNELSITTLEYIYIYIYIYLYNGFKN